VVRSAPGLEPRHVVGRWTAHIAEGIENLGPLTPAVVRSPGVRPLPHTVRSTRENETWIIDAIAVSLDLDASVLVVRVGVGPAHDRDGAAGLGHGDHVDQAQRGAGAPARSAN
jgi:hypothetical protein